MLNASEDFGTDTLSLHGGQEPDPTTNTRAVPIYASISFVFDSTDHTGDLFALKEFGNIYSCIMNPTNDVLEKRLVAMDGSSRWSSPVRHGLTRY